MPETLIIKSITEKLHSSYEQQFTGFYKITNQADVKWYVYFLLGRIVWAQPSERSFRAWHRQITIHSPVLSEQIGKPVSLYYEYWSYAALSRLVKLKQFPRMQFAKTVESCVAEVLFNILQAAEWQYDEFGDLLIEPQTKEAGSMPFVMLENLQAWTKAQQNWQQWQQAGFTKISPNWAPIIKDAETLKEQTPLQAFQTLSSFANGQNTLRDLAIKVKQPIIPIVRSIRPYVAKRLLSFTEIPDIVENAHQGFHLELVTTHQSSDSPNDKNAIGQESSQVNSTVPETTEKERRTSERAEELSTAKSTDVLSVETAFEEDVPANQASTDQVFSEEILIAPEATGESLLERKAAIDASVAKEFALEEPVHKGLSEINPAQKTLEPPNLSTPHEWNQKTRNLDTSSQPAEVQPVEARSVGNQVVDTRSVQENQLNASDKISRKPKDRKRRSRRSNLPKIVYVDDSPADSRTMAAIVEKMGYQYFNVPDPLQALPMLIEVKPKLIFLDLVMPIANGYEVCSQIRRITTFKKIPIIIVTSNDGIADRVRAKIVGASGFMGKPIKEKKVQKVFKKYLSHVSTNR
ncbi:MAG: response regulator [Cyanobacteria bacterium J06650_10]